MDLSNPFSNGLMLSVSTTSWDSQFQNFTSIVEKESTFLLYVLNRFSSSSNKFQNQEEFDIKMLLWSIQSPDLREHRTAHFSFFPRFSSTRPCLRNSPSCASERTGSSSLFSTTTSQLTESTDLPFQLVAPLHLPSAVGQKVSLLHSLPSLLARTSMAAGQPERAAENPQATRGADQRLALCPRSDASWENGTP